MNFINQTGLEADWTHGFQSDGRERLIVLVKATYDIPAHGEEPQLAKQQVPLTTADEFWGEPGLSAPRHESDYAHHKARCDVLVNGAAYVRKGRKRRRVRVALRVGPISKSFFVVGDRRWLRIPFLGARPGIAEPFCRKPFSFADAFGGLDDSRGERRIRSFVRNPVGRGYRRYLKGIHGELVPSTEEVGRPIRSPRRKYRPIALGPVGRNWQPRASFAGTYDQAWLEKRIPFLPDDFDDRYFQAAPEDQQMPYPQGAERVELENLSPAGFLSFSLPRRLHMPVLFVRPDGSEVEVEANVDTVVIEPDESRFTLTWRAPLALRKNCFEIHELIVGEMPRAWHRARRSGDKDYYSSLAAFVAAERETEE